MHLYYSALIPIVLGPYLADLAPIRLSFRKVDKPQI